MFAFIFDNIIKAIIVTSVVIFNIVNILLTWVMNFPILLIFFALLPFAVTKAYLEKLFKRGQNVW
jgi:hypothetical protein